MINQTFSNLNLPKEEIVHLYFTIDTNSQSEFIKNGNNIVKIRNYFQRKLSEKSHCSIFPYSLTEYFNEVFNLDKESKHYSLMSYSNKDETIHAVIKCQFLERDTESLYQSYLQILTEQVIDLGNEYLTNESLTGSWSLNFSQMIVLLILRDIKEYDYRELARRIESKYCQSLFINIVKIFLNKKDFLTNFISLVKNVLMKIRRIFLRLLAQYRLREYHSMVRRI